jgi:hypothetical protein
MGNVKRFRFAEWKESDKKNKNTFLVKKLQSHGQISDDEASLKFGKLHPVLDVIQKLA